MVARHPLDVGEGLLCGGDQLRPSLLQPPLVLVLLVEPADLPLISDQDF